MFVDGTATVDHHLRHIYDKATCPIFVSRIDEMEKLATEFPSVHFLVIYSREAHPGELRAPHQSFADKRRAADQLRTECRVRRRILIDGLDGAVHRQYGGAPDCAYVIGTHKDVS